MLVDGEQIIWETMAILEYLAEHYPEKGLWPGAREARAVARSISNEMHTGFAALRSNMHMNINKFHRGKGMGERIAEDIARVSEI